MLRTLLGIWRKKTLLHKAFDSFYEMLGDAQWMFVTTAEVLLKKKEPQDISGDLFSKDKEINSKERSIRRNIVEYLAFNPSGDIPACLALMSIVKDAERIGDYSKNIFELADIYSKRERVSEGFEIAGLEEEIKNLFDKTRKAFKDSDEDKAREYMEEARTIAKKCDARLQHILGDGLPSFRAVSNALLSRYFKRVTSHLFNIASSICNPVPDIDFYKKR